MWHDKNTQAEDSFFNQTFFFINASPFNQNFDTISKKSDYTPANDSNDGKCIRNTTIAVIPVLLLPTSDYIEHII